MPESIVCGRTKATRESLAQDLKVALQELDPPARRMALAVCRVYKNPRARDNCEEIRFVVILL